MTGKRKTLAYLDDNNGVNSYVERMCELLGDIVSVDTFPSVAVLVTERLMGRRPFYDSIFVSWIENDLVSKSGYISLLGILKVFAKALLLRLCGRRLVFFRHNRYPHATHPSSAKCAQRLTDILATMFDVRVLHSEAENVRGYLYCPHPLYKVVLDENSQLPADLERLDDFIVIFGRMESYKHIEAFISGFPEGKMLLVIGAAESGSSCVARLLAMQRKNVMVRPGYLSNAQAQAVIARASALVITHADKSAIVSGSFFFGISIGTPVYALETSFIRHVASMLGSEVVVAASDIESLCKYVGSSAPVKHCPAAVNACVEKAFGDDAVRRSLKIILDEKAEC